MKKSILSFCLLFISLTFSSSAKDSSITRLIIKAHSYSLELINEGYSSRWAYIKAFTETGLLPVSEEYNDIEND